jgi:hypothetical protein
MDFTRDNENSTSGSHDQEHHIHLIIKNRCEEMLQHYFEENILKARGLPFGAVPALPITATRPKFFFDDRCSQR